MDGISTISWSQGSCTHTEEGRIKPWWRVDLGQVKPVSEVYIVNKDNPYAYRLYNFEIRVGRFAFLILPDFYDNLHIQFLNTF